MTGQDSLVSRGHEALGKAAWHEARLLFEQALAQSETAEANEGLSWAAWWLNDGDATIHSREAAYRLYRQAGADLGATRMAMWLATDYEDFRGALPIGRGWRQRARRLLDGQPICAEHGWFSIIEGDVALLIAEDTTTARRCAGEAMAVARQCGVADMDVMALAMEGLALVGEGEIDEGMKRLDEAAASALGGELQDETWVNKVLCYLIYGCERIRDFGRAAQWCELMREVADRTSFAWAQGTCRAHYGGVLISRGKWQEAEKTLSEAVAYLEASRPPWAAEALVRLAELRHRQGRPDEAAELLGRAEWHPLAMLGLAEIALDAGRLQDAGELVERFLRHIPAANRLQRAAALELLVRVGTLSGWRARADEALAALRAISEAVPTLPLRAATCFSEAMMAMAGGDYERARAWFEDAVDLFERSGTPYEAGRARLELAAALVSLGRLERARDEAVLARNRLEALGASFSARRAAALLEDIGRREAAPDSAVAGIDLTERQIEILRLVSQGRNDREIASALAISEHTVHRHVANILLRLDMPTRAAAAAHAGLARLRLTLGLFAAAAMA